MRGHDEMLKNTKVQLSFRYIYRCSGVAVLVSVLMYSFSLTPTTNVEVFMPKIYVLRHSYQCIVLLFSFPCACIVEYMSGQRLTFVETISSFH